METNDSCLIGMSPSVNILQDKLLVTTGQDQCFLFDKATGRFLTSVGHVGNDPEGYSTLEGCWLNHPWNNHFNYLDYPWQILIYKKSVSRLPCSCPRHGDKAVLTHLLYGISIFLFPHNLMNLYRRLSNRGNRQSLYIIERDLIQFYITHIAAIQHIGFAILIGA